MHCFVLIFLSFKKISIIQKNKKNVMLTPFRISYKHLFYEFFAIHEIQT